MKCFKVVIYIVIWGVFIATMSLLIGCRQECGHPSGEWVVVHEPSCSVKGQREYRCTECGEVLKTMFTESLSHQYGDWIIDKEATCLEGGSQHRECINCGRIETKTMEPSGHIWRDWVTDVEATCTVDGVEHHVCIVCGGAEYGVIKAAGHVCNQCEILSEGTCQSEWEYGGYCEKCNEYVTYKKDGGFEHNWTAWEYEEAESCYSFVNAARTCPDCGAEEKTTLFLHHQYADGVCVHCGRKEPGENGQTVTFGSYPQSAVTDETELASLNALVTALPKANQAKAGAWKSFGYTDSEEANYVWYMDVEVDGQKYRGIYYTAKRLTYIDISTAAQSTEGAGEVHWFRWEPLTWHVLENDEGTQLLLCDMIVDCQRYLNHYDSQKDPHRFNYDNSDIRAWLNKDFYQAAFTQKERDKIVSAKVPFYFQGDEEPVKYSENKVFLLSRYDVEDCSYGLSEKTAKRYENETVLYENTQLVKPHSDYAALFNTDDWSAMLYREYDGEAFVSAYLPCGYHGDGFYVTELCDIVPALVLKK